MAPSMPWPASGCRSRTPSRSSSPRTTRERPVTMTRAGRPQSRGIDRRAVRSGLIAIVSTVVVFGLTSYLVLTSAGWPAVQESFLDRDLFWESLPKVVEDFAVNVRMFVIAEILVLILGLALATVRSLPGPVFFPFRVIATVYTDVFRAIPGLVVVFVL